MERMWKLVRAGTLATLALGLALNVTTVLAKPEPKNEKPKRQDPPEWSDPYVSGIVMKAQWVDSTKPGQQTAALLVWSNESNLAVWVYGDDPSVREAIVSGLACVGRYVWVGGDRLDEDELVGRSIQVPNQEMPCESTIASVAAPEQQTLE